MREAAVGQQIVGRIHPEGGNKINIRYALGQNAPNHGPLAKALFKECLADTGSHSDMSETIQFRCPFSTKSTPQLKFCDSADAWYPGKNNRK